jgi:hypothetical protein
LRLIVLQRLDIFCLGAFIALSHTEFNAITFAQNPAAFAKNRAEMHENFFTIIAGNKTISFANIKPLNGALLTVARFGRLF